MTDSTSHFIDSDPWLQYLPQVHRALASRNHSSGLPTSFREVEHNRNMACHAWWESLRYTFRSLLGWNDIPKGLHWLYENKLRTHDEPLIAFIYERWNTEGELALFAIREWEFQGITGSSEPETQSMIPRSYLPNETFKREALSLEQTVNHSPYNGGSNSLHLSHSDYLKTICSRGTSQSAIYHSERKATLIVDSFKSWQSELKQFGETLPSLGERSWHIEVFDREVGYLGKFRQSRVTKEWFTGKHSTHMAGFSF